MRMRTMELSVGAFILAGFLALVILIVNVSGLSLASGAEGYKVYARFENIGGLTVRSKVTISGVTIGKVTAITLDSEAIKALVEMEIAPQYDFLTRDSSVSILTAGLLGEQYIGISIGADEENMVDGDEFDDTQSAIVLEELIGKFLFNKVSE
ncbi:outer membrane lipid asymmetry maintenance protein MlaD [Motiliproteus sp. MSK22-1]|uniref:outer membrane lipid asymmetry maintenance protein MlaD n=1 Tax=Motiliproteus sp. MSK22-1 TaxID=1897630 RepID=UPI000975B66A|nr:outer membrane lipid asymmetry maintenance protein MlaD [Motiliproteus sp. MSK22-1]OMH30357.1 outer membrane lipid asymmetry maintenance protein MlaD [Motiliproteus sp. MSK22-1]